MLLRLPDRKGAEVEYGCRQHRGSVALPDAVGEMVERADTIVTFARFRVGNSLALFQTSTLLTVFLGYKVFRERNILERLIGSLIMIAGAVLILLSK